MLKLTTTKSLIAIDNDQAYTIDSSADTINKGADQSLTGVSINDISTCKPIKSLGFISSSRALLVFSESGTNDLAAVVLDISGSTVTANTVVDLDAAFDPDAFDVIDHGDGINFGIVYGNATEVKHRTVSISGVSITDNNDAQVISSDHIFIHGSGYYDNGKTFIALIGGAGNDEGYYTVLGNTNNARFWQGAPMSFKFNMPFNKIRPRALAGSGINGLVAIGAGEPSHDPVIYAPSPYVTGIANDLSMPTGNVVSALWWL